MRKRKKIMIYLFIFALIILYIVIYAVPSLTGALTKTEILQYGNLRITDDVTCYFVRDEKVYVAANSGTINYYIEDGVQVKQGTKILSITSAQADPETESQYQDIITRLGDSTVELYTCVSEFNGRTSYYVDGYEGYFTPDTMHQLKYENVRKLEPEITNLVRENTLRGEPLYKICDNAEWYLVCWVAAGNISKYERGNNVTVNLPLGSVRATTTDIVEDGDNWLVIFKTNRYYEDFARVRVAAATVVTSDYSGIIISNKSIIASEGAIGVYVKAKNGDYTFKPIKVITTDGENSLVEDSYYLDDEGNKVSTVKTYDEILKNPSKN